jgi:hypothetical protein
VKDRKVLHLTNLDPQLNAADIEVNVLNNHSFHVSGLIFSTAQKDHCNTLNCCVWF